MDDLNVNVAKLLATCYLYLTAQNNSCCNLNICASVVQLQDNNQRRKSTFFPPIFAVQILLQRKRVRDGRKFHPLPEFTSYYHSNSKTWAFSTLSMDWNIPAMAPPPGVKPNFKNPKSSAYESIVTISVCSFFMVLFFVLRMYSRIFVSHSLGWDDCKSKVPSIAVLLLIQDEIPVRSEWSRSLFPDSMPKNANERLIDVHHHLCRPIFKLCFPSGA